MASPLSLVLRRLVRLHGNAVDNAGDSVRADDAAREHRQTVATDVHDLDEANVGVPAGEPEPARPY